MKLFLAAFCCIALIVFDVAHADHMHQKLLNNYLDEEYMNVLKDRVRECGGSNLSFDALSCGEFEYLSNVKNDITEFKLLKPQAFQAAANSPHKPVRYTQAFQDHVVKQQPFVGTIVRKSQANELEKCLNKLRNEQQISSVTEDISLRKCEEIKDIVVPAMVKNNYLFKLDAIKQSKANSSSTEEITNDNNLSSLSVKNEDIELLDYLSHWPAAIPLQPLVPTTTRKCPMNLHSVIVNSNSVDKIKLRLFSETAANEFDPIATIAIQQLHVLHHYSNRYRLSGFPKYFEQQQNSNTNNFKEKKVYSLPKFVEIIINPNEYVVIPNTFLSSLMIEEASKSDANTLFAVSYCFLDASNVNSFASELAKTIKLSEKNKFIFNNLLSNKPLLQMDMFPSERTLEEIYKEAIGSKATDSVAQANEENNNNNNSNRQSQSDRESDSTVTADSNSNRRRSTNPRRRTTATTTTATDRERVRETATVETATTNSDNNSNSNSNNIIATIDNSGSGSASWQERMRWNALIQSLTIPTPNLPQIESISRTNVTLSLAIAFRRDRNDETKFGFEYVVCPAFIDVIDSEDFKDTVNCAQHEILLKENPNQINEIVTESDFDSEQETNNNLFSNYKVVIDKLEPISTYRLRLRLIFGDTKSAFSVWSKIFTTDSVSVPFSVPIVSQIKSLVLSSKQPRKSKKQSSQQKRIRNMFIENNFSVLASQQATANALPLLKNVVLLQFTKPFDDGGAVIERYDVRGRFIQQQIVESPSDSSLSYSVNACNWIEYYSELIESVGSEDSSVISVAVYHLPGNVSMAFQVSAVNRIGRSEWSEASNVIQTVEFAVDERNERQLRIKHTANSDSSWEIAVQNSEQKVSVVQSRNGAASASISSWRCHFSVPATAIGLPLWADPIFADEELHNAADVLGKIVFVLRGRLPLVHKVQRIQAEGAFGVVIVDDGTCAHGVFDQSCLPGANKQLGEGFAFHDVPTLWRNLKIPVVFAFLDDAISLLKSSNFTIPQSILELQTKLKTANSEATAKDEL